MLSTDKKIFVAGHKGMVGSAIVRRLDDAGFSNICVRTQLELDLTDQAAVNYFFDQEKPDYVVIAAAKVGGIYSNDTFPAEFIYENLMIECNLINGAYQAHCGELLFLGSSCIYPRAVTQPMREDALLTDVLEPTNEPYAVAKIAGIKLCESYNRQYGTDYRSVMPTNLYGPNDNYHPDNSHVIPGLIRRFHQAKVDGDTEVVVWGSGNQMREFLHVDDMAAACLHMMQLDRVDYQKHTGPMLSHINVGTGEDVTIRELAELVRKVVGLEAKLVFDTSKPDGAPRKLMDVSRINSLGWTAAIGLEDGLTGAYGDYLKSPG